MSFYTDHAKKRRRPTSIVTSSNTHERCKSINNKVQFKINNFWTFTIVGGNHVISGVVDNLIFMEVYSSIVDFKSKILKPKR
jgi:hypothetical protein